MSCELSTHLGMQRPPVTHKENTIQAEQAHCLLEGLYEGISELKGTDFREVSKAFFPLITAVP